MLHKVSLQTLMDRGLQGHWLLARSTQELQDYIANDFQGCDPWEIGVTLGCFARMFGTRAPLKWISYQLFHDCIRVTIVRDDVVRLSYKHSHIDVVDYEYFYDLTNGTGTILCDLWLYNEWKDATEESMTWDLIEFSQTWHNLGCEEATKELSVKEKLLYDKEMNRIRAEYDRKRKEIEARAIELGL